HIGTYGRGATARDKDLHRRVTTSVDIEAFRDADRVDDGLHTAGWKNSTTLPEGSCSRTCLPPGPSMMSLRNGAPGLRRRTTSVAMSSTIRWMRFQPPGPGLTPSGMGRPAELVGPLSNSRKLPRVTLANAGAELVSTSKSRNFV